MIPILSALALIVWLVCVSLCAYLSVMNPMPAEEATAAAERVRQAMSCLVVMDAVALVCVD